MELTVQNVYGLLLRSKLLPLEEARTMYARWQDEAGEGAGNLARFSAWMVAHHYVTEYQAALLARGHADGFFLGEYTILERLGKGRMAGVYKAKHRLGQIVAIKVLPPSKARDPLLLARFQREARLALRLNHPNIVRAFQVGKTEELHYLVMEHLEGTTLEEVLTARKRLGPAEAVRIIYQALLGLQHIHEQGLVHRDLKPSNLMLVPPRGGEEVGGTVKILDIGLGRALFDESGGGVDSGLTCEGVLLGTPDYMAPEQARDPRLADIRADIYSLGCVLYHTLVGQPPFPDTNIISQMVRHATESPRPLRDFNAAIPDGLQHILNWMMAKDPAGRYPTPARAAAALEVFLAAGTQLSRTPEVDARMQTYLSWLETENTQDYPAAPEEPPPARSPAAGVTIPVMALPPVQGKPPPVAPSSGRLSKPGSKPGVPTDRASQRRKKRPPTPVVQEEELSAGPPPIAPVEVELVAVPPPVASGRLAAGLTRRDLVLFFTGVASGLLAYAIGRGLAALFSQPRSREQD